MSALSTVEKKVLGAMLLLSDDSMRVEATHKEIARKMGYKEPGGIITFALKTLEMKNYINVLGERKYRITI